MVPVLVLQVVIQWYVWQCEAQAGSEMVDSPECDMDQVMIIKSRNDCVHPQPCVWTV